MNFICPKMAIKFNCQQIWCMAIYWQKYPEGAIPGKTLTLERCLFNYDIQIQYFNSEAYCASYLFGCFKVAGKPGISDPHLNTPKLIRAEYVLKF